MHRVIWILVTNVKYTPYHTCMTIITHGTCNTNKHCMHTEYTEYMHVHIYWYCTLLIAHCSHYVNLTEIDNARVPDHQPQTLFSSHKEVECESCRKTAE